MIRIKELRKEKGINQQKLAMELNITQAGISKYELGKAEPDISMLIHLADYFDVSVDYLIGRTDYPASLKPHTPQEEALLEKIRSLDRADRKKLEGYLDCLLGK